MLRKLTIPVIAALGVLPVAAGDLYILGDGTPTGWSLDHMIRLSETYENSNVYTTVCFLDNEKGGTFRLQSVTDWDNSGFYGAESESAPIDNDSWMPLVSGGDGWQFKVVTPGVYYVEANLNERKVKINRMGQIYLVGNVKDHAWSLDGCPMYDSQEAPGQYWGRFTLEGGDYANPGEFKFTTDSPRGWDLRHFLLRKNKYEFEAGKENNDSYDIKWSVGDPDPQSHEERDLVAGRYDILVDAAAKAVKFFMCPEGASLVGPGVLSSWGVEAGSPGLAAGEDCSLTGRHIFFRAGELFKVVVDGKYYGSDSWALKTLEDYTKAYLRVVNEGADFVVATSGFRDVAVRPSDAGDGTLSLEISAPQSVWYEGVCSLDYDEASRLYVNHSGLNWLPAETSYDVFVGGDVVASVKTAATGWYRASVTFDGSRPSYNLDRLATSLEGEALGGSLALGELEAEDQRFIGRRVYLNGGVMRGRIGDSLSPEVNVAASGYYTVTLDMVDGVPRISLRGPVEVNMPLTAEDFKDGTKHYFLVGQRMGAWRLQPEWEFIPQGDGTFAIPTRALYNGYVMVGEVDNYEDYITQTYRGYSHTDLGTESKIDPRNDEGGEPRQDIEVTREMPLALLPSIGGNGCAEGKYTGTRYNDIKRTSPATQHGGWEAMKTRLIHILTPDGYNDVEHIQSFPARVDKIVLHVDGEGHPSNIRFDKLNTSPRALAEIRTFALVGSSIGNSYVSYSREDGVTSPLNNQEGYGGSTWSEAWIQFDNHAKPYVDGNGEYIYHTSFTRDWLRAHPSYFNFGEDFEYTSNNITFTYAPDLTHDNQFGKRTVTTGNNFTRNEVVHTYWRPVAEGENIGRNHEAVHSLDDMLDIPAEDRACFVVEDMWMEGMFKIWCGWGGSATNYEFEDNGSTYTRWFRSNGSHGRIQEDCTAFYSAGNIMGFTIFEDMDAANFGIGYGVPSTESYVNPKVDENGVIRDEYKNQPERRFFKRVEIWFNLKSGFAYQGPGQASVIMFYQEKGGPNITIEKAGTSQISYNFNIPLIVGMPEEADQADFGNVVKYSIYRIAIDDEGNEGEPVHVETVDRGEGSYLTPDGLPRKDFGNIDIVDPATLAPGRYRYMIETQRANSPEVMSAKSNILRIDPPQLPSGVENVGQDEEQGGFRLQAKAVAGEWLLRVSGSSEIGWLTICSVNGTVVNRLRVAANAATVDISALPAGVYVATANNSSVRFLKR